MNWFANLVPTGETTILLPSITALKDGISRSGFSFDTALHESIYALIIAAEIIWGCILVILWGEWGGISCFS